jgi:hypothetical protein
MCASSLYIGGKLNETVDQYAHLGHVITSQFDDICDITHRRNCFVGQVNSVLRFSNLVSNLFLNGTSAQEGH